MEGKDDLYVIHIRDSKSSRNADGQPASSLKSSLSASSAASLSTITGGSLMRLSSSHMEEAVSERCVADVATNEGDELAEGMDGGR
jgi:hypothetical protein